MRRRLMAIFNSRLLKRLWEFVSPNRRWLMLLCICFIANQATTVVMPVAIGKVLDQFLPAGNRAMLNATVLVLLGLLAVKCLLVFWEREISVLVGSLLVRDVRIRVHSHFLKMSLRFLDDYQTGRIVGRILGDTECVKNLLLGGVLNTAASTVRFIFVLATLLYLDWRMTLVSCAALPVFLLGFWRSARGMKFHYHDLNEKNAQLFSSLNETFFGMRVVKTYAGERRTNSNFLRSVHEILRESLFVSRRQHLASVIWEGTAWASLIALIWYGGHRVIDGTLTVGELVAFYGLLGQMQGPIADLVNINASLQPAITSLRLLDHVLSTEPEIQDHPNAQEAGTLRGHIVFDNVEFTYKTPPSVPQPSPVSAVDRAHTLENISLEIKPGECVAIVGASGSGKSTLLNVLTRLYDIDSGVIRVDGVDIRDYRLASYLKNFALVLQDNFLFRASIRDNLRYGRWNASDEEIIHAAKLAGAWEFIQKLPGGLDARCAERGVSLSGGQKQRLSIARAILANPGILLLDEATSALDSRTEAQIQAALDELMRGRTTLIVAHRLSTIIHAHKIVVLDAGRIVECGTHHELIQKNGRYAEMFREQFGRVQQTLQAAGNLPRTISTALTASGRLIASLSSRKDTPSKRQSSITAAG